MTMQLDSDCCTPNNIWRISPASANGFCCHGMKSLSKTHTPRKATNNAPAMTVRVTFFHERSQQRADRLLHSSFFRS